jgi:hypothetical protein
MTALSLTLGILLLAGGAQKPPPSFRGDVRLPVDLYTPDGARLERGPYIMEVKIENERYNLVFLQDDQPKATIKGDVLPEDGSYPSGFPLIGAQYLRSSDDPVGTEAERHFSKTGLPHYQEESRDWKATMRVYTTDDPKQAIWLFEQREPGRKWSHVLFKLNLNAK